MCVSPKRPVNNWSNKQRPTERKSFKSTDTSILLYNCGFKLVIYMYIVCFVDEYQNVKFSAHVGTEPTANIPREQMNKRAINK